MGLRYRFEELPTVQALVDAVAAGRVDAGVAAITVTAARKRVIDFTQPFYATGLGVAVPSEGVTAWLPVLRTFLSFSFLQAVLALLGIALAVGVLIWLFERRHNKAVNRNRTATGEKKERRKAQIHRAVEHSFQPDEKDAGKPKHRQRDCRDARQRAVKNCQRDAGLR